MNEQLERLDCLFKVSRIDPHCPGYRFLLSRALSTSREMMESQLAQWAARVCDSRQVVSAGRGGWSSGKVYGTTMVYETWIHQTEMNGSRGVTSERVTCLSCCWGLLSVLCPLRPTLSAVSCCGSILSGQRGV